MLTPLRPVKIKNLGAVFSKVHAAAHKVAQNMQDIGEDLRAFGAPGECAELAYRNVDKPMIEAILSVQQETGMSWPAIVDELHARCPGRWVNWTFYSLMIPSALEDL